MWLQQARRALQQGEGSILNCFVVLLCQIATAVPVEPRPGIMVVRVGGSFAYLAGDGMLTFDDRVQTVGDLRAAIEETTKIPGIKQV